MHLRLLATFGTVISSLTAFLEALFLPTKGKKFGCKMTTRINNKMLLGFLLLSIPHDFPISEHLWLLTCLLVCLLGCLFEMIFSSTDSSSPSEKNGVEIVSLCFWESTEKFENYAICTLLWIKETILANDWNKCKARKCMLVIVHGLSQEFC